MATKLKTTRAPKNGGNADQLLVPSGRKIAVQQMAVFQSEPTHIKLSDRVDDTLYCVKIEPIHSDEYGDGFKLWIKELPNAKETMTTAVFSPYVKPQLDQLYKLSHDGKQINPDHPVKFTVRAAGRSYRLE